jgi:RES domain-containing protein
MVAPRRIRDSALIDALEKIAPIPFDGRSWRVVRQGRDALMCSAAGGRWDDGTFDVLYTSQKADGAVAEIYFHLSRGLPVVPSRPLYHLFELRVSMNRVLHLADIAAIARLGVNTSRYGALSYGDRADEYPRTQDIGETALFVGFDGLIVPSARWECANIVIFCDRVPPDKYQVSRDYGSLDWADWQSKPFGF